MGIPILQDRCEGGGGSLARSATRRSSLLSVKNVSQTVHRFFFFFFERHA